MAYRKKELYEKALKAVKEHNLFFIDDVSAFIGVSKSTFYSHFPPDSDEMNDIKEALEANRVKTKSSLRAKMYQSGNTGQMLALYRLICTPEERQMLNQNYIDVTTNGREMKPEPITVEIIDSREQVRKDDEGM